MTLKNVIKPHVLLTGAFFLVSSLALAKSMQVPNCNSSVDPNCSEGSYLPRREMHLPQRISGCKTFVEEEYLYLYPDVKAAVDRGSYRSGYQHFMQVGITEKRQICGRKIFSCLTYVESEYLGANPDVAEEIKAKKYKSGFEHYMRKGQHERRQICAKPQELDPHATN